MLEICFLILKLLVIIILCILGLVLLVLLLVFFAPIRYYSEGCKSEEKVCVKGFVTYLSPIVRVIVNYPDKEIAKVKILGITVYPAKPKEKVSDAQAEEKTKESKTPKFTAEASEAVVQKEKGFREDKLDQKTKNTEAKQEQGSSKNNTLDTIGDYASLFSENKELILNVLGTILRAFKTILPSKCKVYAVFGTGQADTTGYIYAVYCSLKENLPGEIYLEPIWTEAQLEGEYYLKGKIRIIHFLIAFMKIIANKEARLLIKKLRRV